MSVIDYPLTSIETLDGPVPQGAIIARETLDLMREESRCREQWLRVSGEGLIVTARVDEGTVGDLMGVHPQTP
ncbi:hypothetical protein [Pandoraea sp. PE-S2R-1]|uniref:hypothetical protein n=1 Tax=Pandoraea sp. PE-S2R-1 TaxID=1986994 RepID=UPI000B40100F|nr:hypothetical protein [Pandoraea sp. PE-S2R-1]